MASSHPENWNLPVEQGTVRGRKNLYRLLLHAADPELCSLTAASLGRKSFPRVRLSVSADAANIPELLEVSLPALWSHTGPNTMILGDNLPVVQELPSDSFQLIYIDPPFNTGRTQTRATTKTRRVERTGDMTRVGFGGHTYESLLKDMQTYDDDFVDYWAFLAPRLLEAWRLLTPTGTLYLHLDYREVHYAKVLLDQLFGRESFLNEIIWAYDYGGRTNKRWPSKHDNILVYVKDPKNYHFNNEEVDREPYMAPGLVTPEKAARGKLPTDVWWHTIVSPTGKEKTGYPTQKPLGVLRRIVAASSSRGDWVLDFFAGSGTTGAAAAELGRKYLLVDESEQAARVIQQRLPDAQIVRAGDANLGLEARQQANH